MAKLSSIGLIPQDTNLQGLSLQVFDILAKHTAFPWSILKAQCHRIAADPSHLSRDQLCGDLVNYLADGVARFSSPEKGERIRRELKALCDSRLEPGS